MMRLVIPSPESSTCTAMTSPLSPGPGIHSSHTSIDELPASMLFCTSSRRKSVFDENCETRLSTACSTSESSTPRGYDDSRAAEGDAIEHQRRRAHHAVSPHVVADRGE